MYNSQNLKTFLDKWKKQQEHLKNISKQLKELKIPTSNLEEKVIFDTKPEFLELSDLKVAAVDSGFSLIELANLDLVIYKVAGVIFNFKNSKLSSYAYVPQKTSLDFEYMEGLDYLDSQRFCSLARLKAELKTAIEIATNHKPNILFLDGSLLPIPADKPTKNSPLWQTYLNLLNDYKKLFEICSANKIFLAGVIKETKSNKFVKLLQKASKDLALELENYSDIFVLNHILEKNQRTAFFDLSSNSENIILNDFDSKPNILFFYIKVSNSFFPLRVELLKIQGFENFPPLFSLLCSTGSKYSYPSVLIEADLKARISQTQINQFLEKDLAMNGKPLSFFSFKFLKPF
ncbi:MAG: DNA double-strand break repair nuclease NurA [Candidatus Anstonellaceae archaeon]